ncbi:MAG: hypothetical protein IPJ19_12385 [Planctomycetes bacterium]|nr:hypothetical protein [Planctomycetota bacterium]
MRVIRFPAGGPGGFSGSAVGFDPRIEADRFAELRAARLATLETKLEE